MSCNFHMYVCVCVCVVKSVSAERREGDMGNLLGKEKLWIVRRRKTNEDECERSKLAQEHEMNKHAHDLCPQTTANQITTSADDE